ncbi:uncharacterized protein LOC125236415 [Leguminivora glycinivorella]|uniref:uncharacterized protein LOC125236415 n=1 Tax=Leguminivora glycinivorella TaxID=1035111 RepID=UPI00200E9498|nr:uncharacterized protein LOC125236415 [Leguminivora glycinivorella]
MSYCLDVESFINEVKKHPEIWDISHEDNRHKSRKNRAWGEVARLFIEEFDEMSEGDKNDVYRKLHGKWRNIRDSFVRNMKKPDGKKGYMYAKQLSFLNAVYKGSGSEAEENDSNSNQLWDESEDDDRKRKNKRRHFQVLNDCNWSDDETPSTIENLKRKRVTNIKTEPTLEFVDTPPSMTPFAEASFNVPTEDEDRSFFESLLPAVRSFDLDQKLEFRCQVITAIKNIRTSAQHQSSS